MADIESELQEIMDAVYGEEVRGSIHDALDKMNDGLEDAIDRQLLTIDSTLGVSGEAADSAVTGKSLSDIVNYFKVNEETTPVTWERGSLNSSNGSTTSTNATKRCRTAGYLTINRQYVLCDKDALVYVYFYSAASASSFLGHTGAFVSSCSVSDYAAEHFPTATKFKLVGKKADDSQIDDGVSSDVTSCTNHIVVAQSYVKPRDIADLENAFIYRGALANGTDLNLVSQHGMYNLVASFTYDHKPNLPYNTLANMYVLGSASFHSQIIVGKYVIAYRYFTDTETMDWRYLPATIQTLANKVALTNFDDLDDISDTGIYYCNNLSLPDNIPEQVGGLIISFKYDNTYKIQLYMNNLNRVYMRFSASGGYTSWRCISHPKDIIKFAVAKGAWSKTGGYSVHVDAIRASTIFELTPGSALYFYLDPGWTYSIREGDAANKLEERTAITSRNHVHIVKYKYVAVQFNKFDDQGQSINLIVSDFDDSVIIRTSGDAIKADNPDEYLHAIPETYGQLNAVYRAYQLSKAAYTTVATLPLQSGSASNMQIEDVPANTNLTGIPYSSMRETMASVPQATSFHTFMTAIQNPNSYLYTKHYDKEPPSIDWNSRCYYGAVCSTLVAYCYGITNVIPTTISFSTYEGFNPLPSNEQNPYSLKLADMLNKPGHHIVIITDIIKNSRGKILFIEVTEAWGPECRTKQYTPSQIQARYFDDGNIAYRYEHIGDVTYTPDPWIHLDSSEVENPVYATELCPRKGDKANWYVGETVEIDVLDTTTGFTNYVVLNAVSGSQIASSTIPNNNVIQLSNYNPGKYKVRLTKGSTVSEFVYFNVIDMSVSYEDQGNHKVKVTYSSTMGVPSAVYWCNNKSGSTDYKAVRAFYVLTDEESHATTPNNFVIVDEPTDMRSQDSNNGVWLMRMAFRTDFGLCASPLTSVSVVS